jgi:hypothetical protein
MKGSLRCYLHGGRSKGRGKRQSPTSMRALVNQQTRRIRARGLGAARCTRRLIGWVNAI